MGWGASEKLVSAMTDVSSKIALVKKFEALPEQTKLYLAGIESLLETPKTFGVALAFLFMKIEEGQHRALKCGLIKKHKCNSAKVDDALEKQHFTRPYFRTVYKNIFGKEIPKAALDAIQSAEKARDKLIHGKSPAAPELRNAVSQAFDYIQILGAHVETETKKNPFGDLRGLAGRAKLMESIPTYWLLKGMGFYNAKEVEAP